MPITNLYLPREGLQGELIPSFILWEDMDVEVISISYKSPLNLKEVYNSESWNDSDNNLIVKSVEHEGYLGLLFDSHKVSTVIEDINVEYLFQLPNNESISETKSIQLFRPQLSIEKIPKRIVCNTDTMFVRNRIKIKNIGKGTLIIRISTEDDSQIKIVTPPEQQDFVDKFESDFKYEMSLLAVEFPFFQSLNEQFIAWNKRIRDFEEISDEEHNELNEFMNNFKEMLANEEEFRRAFIEAFIKIIKLNAEFLESIVRLITFFESIVTKNIILVNPFDQIALEKSDKDLIIKIQQTDNLYEDYEDVTLSSIKIEGSNKGMLPIYRLFEWG